MAASDFLLEKKLRELDPELHRRFTDSVFVLHQALMKFKRLFPEYTDHSEFHSMNVINFCNTLIGEKYISHMNAHEIYVLLMSCYLHDIGMGVTPKDYEEFKDALGAEEYFKKWPDRGTADFVRHSHHDFSGMFIRKYAQLLEIPSEEHLFAVVQTCRGHRRTDLFDENEYPVRYKVTDQDVVHLPYLAAVIRLADEVDVVADRNPKLLYDIESLTDPYQNAHYRLLEAVPRMQIFPDRFVLDVETDDELLWLAIRELAGKMQRTLDYCRSVVEKRTPFEISQKKVDLNRI